MRITWYGHAAFLIETEGLRIILDPYRSPDSGGYVPIDEPADLVVVSHENDRYHSHLGQIMPPFEVVRAPRAAARGARGQRASGSRPCHVFETPERLPEDEVTIIHFRAEGLHVVFLGDLGHPLDGGGTRPAPRRRGRPRRRRRPADDRLPRHPPLLDAIGPRLVLPMHYKTPRINLNIQPLERFLEIVAGGSGDRPGSSFHRGEPRDVAPEADDFGAGSWR